MAFLTVKWACTAAEAALLILIMELKTLVLHLM